MTTTAGRWTKLYGSLIDGEALAMSRDARLLGVEAEAWSDDQETDGRIPRNALRRITDAEDTAPLVAELIGIGRWAETDDGWEIVGFLDRHDSADARADGRAADHARIKGWRSHRDGSHNADGPKSCDRCNAVRNDVTNSVRNDVRTEVDATRREATAKRREASGLGRVGPGSAASAGAAAAPPGRRGARHPMTAETKAKIAATRKANDERRRAEAEERAEKERRDAEFYREQQAEAQRKRDEEWLALGGDPKAIPVSADKLFRRKYPNRRPLR